MLFVVFKLFLLVVFWDNMRIAIIFNLCINSSGYLLTSLTRVEDKSLLNLGVIPFHGWSKIFFSPYSHKFAKLSQVLDPKSSIKILLVKYFFFDINWFKINPNIRISFKICITFVFKEFLGNPISRFKDKFLIFNRIDHVVNPSR